MFGKTVDSTRKEKNCYKLTMSVFICGDKFVVDKYNQLLTADAKPDADLQNGCQTVCCYT